MSATLPVEDSRSEEPLLVVDLPNGRDLNVAKVNKRNHFDMFFEANEIIDFCEISFPTFNGRFKHVPVTGLKTIGLSKTTGRIILLVEFKLMPKAVWVKGRLTRKYPEIGILTYIDVLCNIISAFDVVPPT